MAEAQAFQSAFDQLLGSVASSDAVILQSTSLQDIFVAAEEIQKYQMRRNSFQNFSRLRPFLESLDRLSGVIEVVCNGSILGPLFLNMTWAPVKLMIQMAARHGNTLDKLLDTYGKISESMSQFDRLQGAFHDNLHFRRALRMVYSDILEFHQRSYKFFRKPAWYIVFESVGATFEHRFRGILKRIAQHSDLVIREATTIHIVETRLETRQMRQSIYLHESISWLKFADEQQQDELERLSRERYGSTCEWVLRNPLFQSWNNDLEKDSILWIYGTPGTGKSVLSAYIIQWLLETDSSIVAYNICNASTTGNILVDVLRGLTVQLLRSDLTFAKHIHDQYTSKGLASSIPHLRKLLKEILRTASSVRIVIDGLDRYPEPEQILILKELDSLTHMDGNHCKILILGRESMLMNRFLRGASKISIKDELDHVQTDIRAYVRDSLEAAQTSWGAHVIREAAEHIVAKSNGMFLWAHLMIQKLERCHTIEEVEDAKDTLPEGLGLVYDRVLQSFGELGPENSKLAITTLQWMACSFSPLTVNDLQSILASSSTLGRKSISMATMLENLKPLVEEGAENTVNFHHFSFKKYILHVSSGPFIQHRQAHYSILSSCIASMNSWQALGVTGHSKNQVEIGSTDDCHELHNYATKFWFHHLLECSKYEESSADDGFKDLLGQLRGLLANHKIAKEGQAPNTIALIDDIKNQMEVWVREPQARRIGLDLFALCKLLSHFRPNIPLSGSKSHQDPILFSDISQLYQIVSGLLSHRKVKKPRRFNTSQGSEPHKSQSADCSSCSESSCDVTNGGSTKRSSPLRVRFGYHSGAVSKPADQGSEHQLECSGVTEEYVAERQSDSDLYGVSEREIVPRESRRRHNASHLTSISPARKKGNDNVCGAFDMGMAPQKLRQYSSRLTAGPRQLRTVQESNSFKLQNVSQAAEVTEVLGTDSVKKEDAANTVETEMRAEIAKMLRWLGIVKHRDTFCSTLHKRIRRGRRVHNMRGWQNRYEKHMVGEHLHQLPPRILMSPPANIDNVQWLPTERTHFSSFTTTSIIDIPRRHVILFDGTCSDKGVGAESVIAQLNELLSTDPNGKQSTIYYTGVGTGFSTAGKAWGGLTGRGLHDKIRKAFDYLASNYRPIDLLVIVGYSRGGFAAMVLAALLGRVGVPTVRSSHAIRQLWQRFQNRELEDPTICESIMTHESFQCVPVKTELLCCIDAVAAEGAPRTGLFGVLKSVPSYFKRLSFCVQEMPSIYRHIRALHEFRKPFMNIEIPVRRDRMVDASIIWMPGSHRDLARGNATLIYTIAQLKAVGCWFDDRVMNRKFPGFTTCPDLPEPASLREWPVANLENTFYGYYSLLGFHARVPGSVFWHDPALELRECVHISARYRLYGMSPNAPVIPGHRPRLTATATGFEWCKEGTWDLNGVWNSNSIGGRTVLNVQRDPLPEARVGQIEAKLTFCIL